MKGYPMSETYEPPKVWTWDAESGGKFASTNRPVAGATHDKTLPRGDHRYQLYSLATPNGVKATVMFEELLEAGHDEAEYDAWLIDIGEGDQFGSGFVELNPNSKIPALLDLTGEREVRVFESGAILWHLANRFDMFLGPNERRAEMLSWLFWQVGSAPYLGGGFGHFYAYAPEKLEYPINRFAMETKRQLDVLERQLAETHYVAGPEYTIADMAIWPWYGQLVLGRLYDDAATFLDVESYANVMAWAKKIDARPPVQRGRMVNRTFGEPHEQLHERHGPGDFDTRTQDRIGEGT